MIRSLGIILNKPLMNFEQESDMISFRINMASYDLVSIYTNVLQQPKWINNLYPGCRHKIAVSTT